ncbi:MAG: DUF3307 domain-containing protein [Deltaproteobacteria bacterium]|nr:DUF3307 domain-containing protein [Deltaproteobacteria bacterium]
MGLETLDIVVCLMAGHLLGDFLLQTDCMAGNKGKLRILTLHATVVTATSYLLAGAWLEWRILLGVFGSHLAIDGIKALSGQDGPTAFLLDQGGHLAALAILGTYWIPGAVTPSWQAFCPFYVRGMLLLAGAILCIRAGGFWIGRMVAPYQAALAEVPASLPQAGRVIGQLERALIFLFVLAGEPQGVGFLVAAKSILRFGEVKAGQRREAEYILIGTLMSFVWGLLAAFATKALLSLLGPFHP